MRNYKKAPTAQQMVGAMPGGVPVGQPGMPGPGTVMMGIPGHEEVGDDDEDDEADE